MDDEPFEKKNETKDKKQSNDIRDFEKEFEKK
jgi:hypothetical protein